MSQSVYTIARCETVTPHPEANDQHRVKCPHIGEILFFRLRYHQTMSSHAHHLDLAQGHLLGPDNPLAQKTGDRALCLLPLQALRSVLAPRPPPRTHMDLNALPHHWRTRCQLHHHHMLPCTAIDHGLTQTLIYLCRQLPWRFLPNVPNWFTKPIPSRPVPRSSCLYDGWIREVRPVRWLATSIPPPWRQLQCLQVLQPRPGIQRRHDRLGSVVPPKIPPFQPRWVRGTDSHHPAYQRIPPIQNSPFWPASSTWRCRGSYLWPFPALQRAHKPSPRPSSAIGSNLQVTIIGLHAPNEVLHNNSMTTSPMWSLTSSMPTFHITNGAGQTPTSNITVDQATSRLRFCSWEANVIFTWRTSEVVDSRRGSTREVCSPFYRFGGRWLQVRIDQRTRCPDFTFDGRWLQVRIDPPLRTFSFDMWLCIITPLFPAMFFSVLSLIPVLDDCVVLRWLDLVTQSPPFCIQAYFRHRWVPTEKRWTCVVTTDDHTRHFFRCRMAKDLGRGNVLTCDSRLFVP